MSELSFPQLILTWYAQNKRELPWRNISDPYKIWVSEIILQQTQIVQGHDYYLRFLSTFPTIESLANASEDEVLRVWQGLGYYSRARNMHKAAKQVMEDGGVFPQDYDNVRALKGVGDYTAAAICSFAYNMPYAVVDGNVYRVLSRYYGISVPIDTTQGKKHFAAFAQHILPKQQYADYNQGLMDFGATQCVPSNPNCAQCILNDACVAANEHNVGGYPVKSRKTAQRQRFFVYVKVVTPTGTWLHRRSKKDIWKGLYEYLLLEFDHKPDINEIQQADDIKSIKSKGAWSILHAEIKHVLTHQIIYASLYSIKFDVPVHFDGTGWTLVEDSKLAQYAMPQLIYKLDKFEV